MLEFKILYNPDNILFKHEVWIKGEAINVDHLGQHQGTRKFVTKARAFPTLGAAEKFVKYQGDYYGFKGTL